MIAKACARKLICNSCWISFCHSRLSATALEYIVPPLSVPGVCRRVVVAWVTAHVSRTASAPYYQDLDTCTLVTAGLATHCISITCFRDLSTHSHGAGRPSHMYMNTFTWSWTSLSFILLELNVLPTHSTGPERVRARSPTHPCTGDARPLRGPGSHPRLHLPGPSGGRDPTRHPDAQRSEGEADWDWAG